MKAILIKGKPLYHQDIKDEQTVELFGKQIDGFKYADDTILIELGFKDVPVQTLLTNEYFGAWYETATEILRYIITKTKAEEDAELIAKTKDEFKNNLTGVFAYATTPDGTKEYAIKIGNDGKIVTVLIP